MRRAVGDVTDPTGAAVELMLRFADRTGVTSGESPRRYLWTDAFAVCNFLGLGQPEVAQRLVDQVHRELGRYAAGDRRSGWISGLDDRSAAAHPTKGGLRIGKPLPERDLREPFDPELEWDRDGQYFHYLTKWMHALDRVAYATGEPKFHVWARELADTAHRAFVYGPPGGKRMAWKLSVDLSRPLVPSMGQHDPLDGLVTCMRLDETARALGVPRTPDLALATADFKQMLQRGELATEDPLGLGGLLVDAFRLSQVASLDEALIGSLLSAAAPGLSRLSSGPDLRAPADHRLAFRELGLAIGLAGVSMLLEDEPYLRGCGAPVRSALRQLAPYVPLRRVLESFWMHPNHQRISMWTAHADINEVMLATSLVPVGFLGGTSST